MFIVDLHRGIRYWWKEFHRLFTSSRVDVICFGFTSNLCPVFYHFPHSFLSPSLSIFNWPVCWMLVDISRLTLYDMLFHYLCPPFQMVSREDTSKICLKKGEEKWKRNCQDGRIKRLAGGIVLCYGIIIGVCIVLHPAQPTDTNDAIKHVCWLRRMSRPIRVEHPVWSADCRCASLF